MKTEALISLLAEDVAPVPRRAASRRLKLALAVSLPLSIAMMLAGYGLRRDLVEAMFWPMFWVKLMFPVFMAVAAFVVAQRLARPGVRVGPVWLALAAPVLLVWGLAVLAWAGAAEGERTALLWGTSWRSCAFSIALISAPVFAAALAAMKGLAPTQPALAGAAVGAMAGSAGAAVYALHCVELAAPFLAVWYVAGIALPVVLGAVAGPRLLRW
jgi:hypothetical protein